MHYPEGSEPRKSPTFHDLVPSADERTDIFHISPADIGIFLVVYSVESSAEIVDAVPDQSSRVMCLDDWKPWRPSREAQNEIHHAFIQSVNIMHNMRVVIQESLAEHCWD